MEMGAKVESGISVNRRKALSGLSIMTLALITSCREKRPDVGQITMRPRFVLEDQPTVPVLLEFDVIGVNLGTVDNIFSDEPGDRSYALWFTFNRKASILLHTLSVKNSGKNLIVGGMGQHMGVHPIGNAISNGVLPVLLTSIKTEEQARFLYDELSQSIVAIQYLVAKEENK
jgi:hypothetical protein